MQISRKRTRVFGRFLVGRERSGEEVHHKFYLNWDQNLTLILILKIKTQEVIND